MYIQAIKEKHVMNFKESQVGIHVKECREERKEET